MRGAKVRGGEYQSRHRGYYSFHPSLCGSDETAGLTLDPHIRRLFAGVLGKNSLLLRATGRETSLTSVTAVCHKRNEAEDWEQGIREPGSLKVVPMASLDFQVYELENILVQASLSFLLLPAKNIPHNI